MQNPQFSEGTTASLASQNRADATNGSISANPNDPFSLSVSNALQPPSPSGAEACTLQALLDQVQSVQGRLRANKKRRLDAIFDHVVRFARNVDRFSKAIDIYIQGSTHGAAFVWGSLRILLRVLDHLLHLHGPQVAGSNISR